MRIHWKPVCVVVCLLVTVPEVGWTQPPGRIMRPTGSIAPTTFKIVSPTGIRPVASGRESVALGPRELKAGRIQAPVEVLRQNTATRYVLPYDVSVRGITTAGPVGVPNRNLQLIAEIEGGGLRFRPSEGRFIGQFSIGLVDRDHPQTTDALPIPVNVHLSADADKIDPSALTIDRMNVGSLTPVTVQQIEARDSVRVHVTPDFDSEGVVIWLPVKNSRVVLRRTPERIQGFGLEAARLVAELPPGIRPDGHVIFSSNRGTPEPGEALTGKGFVTSLIRSRSTGRALVTAECPPFLSGTASVDFAWPIAFAVAAILGGLIGGIAAHLRRANKANVRWAAYIISGALVGFIVGIAYAAGINLLPIALVANVGVSEAAVFVFAALGGVVGVPYLRSLVGKSG